jgi:hypothetical protein
MTESISELISAYLYGHITAAQYEELRAWLAADPQHVREYIQEAYLHHATRLVLQRREVERAHPDAKGRSKSDSSELFRKAIESDIEFLEKSRGHLSPEEVRRLADRQLAAFLEEQHRQERREQRQAGLEPWTARLKRSLSSALGTAATVGVRTGKLAAVVAMIALPLTLLVSVFCLRENPEVASLADTLDARWGVNIERHASLHNGRFRLHQGYARLLFRSGAEVSIEAPAEFRLESAKRMTLLSGRVFAEVPPSARGFTVDTPQASIVDLGTQFGVKVESGISSDLHLFKGKASLMPTGAAVSEIITAGQASSVDAEGQVRSIAVDDKAFVRRFFPQSGFIWRGQPIDLADVVGGGNGFGTGQLNRWLEISAGTDGTKYIVNGQTTQQYQTTDNRYHRVLHLPYVDGVFSPDGGAGPVQVSSQKHLWPDCPKTSGTYFEDVFNGDHIPAGAKSHGLVLNGQAFGTREHPAIALHSNAGITFDLDAMRRDMPGLEIIEFKATCGISEDVRKHLDGTEKGRADFWVLVDGKKRFEAVGVDVNSKPPEISVPLAGHERFVTLVTTDGDGRPNYDWCFFAEPRLEVRIVQ